jgi:hypothetical protein
VDGMSNVTIRTAYRMWPQYNRRLREVIGAMSPEQLAIRPSPDLWPIWATVGHTAGTRVYWLCDIIGESGAETTPFTDPANTGWEDDLAHPRGADELVEGLDSTWRLIEGCLDRWTPEMLADEIHRDYFGEPRCTLAARSSSGSSPTTRTTAASCRRRSASTGCRRSTSGVPIEDIRAVSWSVGEMTLRDL